MFIHYQEKPRNMECDYYDGYEPESDNLETLEPPANLKCPKCTSAQNVETYCEWGFLPSYFCRKCKHNFEESESYGDNKNTSTKSGISTN